MKLSEIVVPNAIITDLAGAERDDAIAEIVKAIIKREKRGSTGFGHGVAVPHVKHAAISKMAVAIGISRGGIEFNALDKQPVYSIFLLLSPEDKPEDHLDAMEAIFGNLSQETFRRFLRQASSVDDVMTLLEEADAGAAKR